MTHSDLDLADEMLTKSLEINEKLGQKFEIAKDFSGLGNVCICRGDLNTAEDWISQALELFEEIGAMDDVEQLSELLEEIRNSKKQR